MTFDPIRVAKSLPAERPERYAANEDAEYDFAEALYRELSHITTVASGTFHDSPALAEAIERARETLRLYEEELAESEYEFWYDNLNPEE